MATPYVDSIYNPAQYPDFQKQLAVAMLRAARQIAAELGTVPKHATRTQLVTKVFANPNGMADQLAESALEYAFATFATSAPTDANLDSTCSALWDAWSASYN